MTNYNINEMRKAIIFAREKGNKRAISAAMCKECGVAEAYFRSYMEDIKKLYKAVAEYCRLKNSPRTDDVELDAKLEALRAQWQEFTKCAEASELSQELRVSTHDASNLVGFCQGFMQDSNNVDFEEKFVAKRVWAMNTMEKFQKYLETDLGIRVAGVEVLTDEERDFLTAENGFLRTITAGNAAIAEAQNQKSALMTQLHSAKSQELKDYLNAVIAKLDEAMDKAQKAIKDAQTGLEAMRAGDVEVEIPDEIAEAEAEAQAEG